MTPFDRFWSFLQRPDIEGGARISNDLEDPGGVTKWGISQRAYPDENIRALTEARARVLCRRDYWDACRCDELPPHVAIALADSAFNQGPATAIKLLQAALALPVDGILGPKTLAAARQLDVVHVNEFLARRLLRYAAAGHLKYQRGWFLRVLRLKDAIASLAYSEFVEGSK